MKNNTIHVNGQMYISYSEHQKVLNQLHDVMHKWNLHRLEQLAKSTCKMVAMKGGKAV